MNTIKKLDQKLISEGRSLGLTYFHNHPEMERNMKLYPHHVIIDRKEFEEILVILETERNMIYSYVPKPMITERVMGIPDMENIPPPPLMINNMVEGNKGDKIMSGISELNYFPFKGAALTYYPLKLVKKIGVISVEVDVILKQFKDKWVCSPANDDRTGGVGKTEYEAIEAFSKRFEN